MVQLQRPLKIEHRNGVACLTLWLCEPFDCQYSFRSTLCQVEQALAKSAPATHTLPPEESDEDCLEGELTWGSRTFSIYFEHALGYMEFSSPSVADVQELRVAMGLT